MTEIEDRTLEVATRVAELLAKHGVATAVIGAVAAAVHNYPRATEDFDLATFTDPFKQLAAVAKELSAMGFDVELREPDADDPLGGVLVVRGDDFRPIEVVNFYNPLGRVADVGRAAIETAQPNVLGTLAVVRLPHLIALKLYSADLASGVVGKPYLDIIELLKRNPDLDRNEVQRLCEDLGLGREFEQLVAKKPGR